MRRGLDVIESRARISCDLEHQVKGCPQGAARTLGAIGSSGPTLKGPGRSLLRDYSSRAASAMDASRPKIALLRDRVDLPRSRFYTDVHLLLMLKG